MKNIGGIFYNYCRIFYVVCLLFQKVGDEWWNVLFLQGIFYICYFFVILFVDLVVGLVIFIYIGMFIIYISMDN